MAGGGAYLGWTPNPGQQEFALSVDGVFELLYGGARGGGKTDAGLAWFCEPEYLVEKRFRGLVLRETQEDLRDWIDRAERMFEILGAKRKGKPVFFEWPTGAKVLTGHLKDEKSLKKYQGQEYQKILIEELTQIPQESWYTKLLACARSTIPGLTPKVFCTTNPGGPGHIWVKKHWGIGQDMPNVAHRMNDGRLRMFIPAKVEDNPTLMLTDPNYVKSLEMLPEPLRSAWRNGNWDIFEGQMFNLDYERHTVEDMPVPDGVPIVTTFDWGFGAPFSWGWWWLDGEGRAYRFAEWYACEGRDITKGPRLADEDIAQGIEDREKEMGLWNIRDRIIRLAGPDCFSKKADYVHGGQKPSTADTFASHGIYLRKGDANRSQKIRQFQARLRVPGDREGGGRPMLQVYRSCKRFIEIIPLLQSDPNNPEDVDQNGPDHIYDEACHLCMFRPMRTGVRVGGGGVPAGGSAGFFNPDAGARPA